MSVLCLKTRTCFVLLVAVLFLSTVSVFLVRNDAAQPAWNNIVSETQKQLNNFKQLNEQPGFHKIAETEPYLQKLGLSDDSASKPSLLLEDWNQLKPVFVIPALSGDGATAARLVDSLKRWLSAFAVVIYDLGLGYFEKKSLKTHCNKTAAFSCQIREFDWSNYPSHVQVLKYGAYRSIIVQEILNTSGAAFYLTPNHVVVSDRIDSALERARSVGVTGWPLNDSTSAISHNKVFTFFHTTERNFYFHRTISPDRLLIYGTPTVRKELMLPWIQCALTFRCVAPVGAQDTGCRTYRKPLFMYSGCHGYDWAVMNIVLGMMFDFEASDYSQPEGEGAFFVTDQKFLKTTAQPKSTGDFMTMKSV